MLLSIYLVYLVRNRIRHLGKEWALLSLDHFYFRFANNIFTPFDTQQEVVSTFFKKSGDDMMLASIFIALFVVTFLAHSPTPSSYSYALVLQKQCYVNCLCGYETVSGYFYLSKSLNVRTSLTQICIFIRITW